MHPTYLTYRSRARAAIGGAETDRAGVLGPNIGADRRHKGGCGGREACEVRVVVLVGTMRITAK